MIIPKRLQPGDEIRVIAPSDSLQRVGGYDANLPAKEKLEKMGFKVTFGSHVNDVDVVDSSPIPGRAADLHEAFRDLNVKGILTVIGGYTSNELLPYIDFDLIKANPKIICGFSDFTSLSNAITAKTGLVTYYEPAFATLKMMGELGDYQDEYWHKAVHETGKITLSPSEHWSSDAWFDPTVTIKKHPNDWTVYNPGVVSGVTVGGNLNTLYLLQGTEFQPQLDDRVLLVEFSDDADYLDFSRNLASLLQIAKHPRALLIGRFAAQVGMSEEILRYTLDKFPILKEIPVIYNVNFGHTPPIFTIPLGQEVTVDTDKKFISFKN